MEDLVIETLSSFGYPVFLQGSLLPDEPYPDNFFTFWENSSDGEFYDNDEAHTTYNYTVAFYSSDAESVYTTIREAKKLLRAAGFALSGDGYSMPSDKDSHDGRGINVNYLGVNTIE